MEILVDRKRGELDPEIILRRMKRLVKSKTEPRSTNTGGKPSVLDPSLPQLQRPRPDPSGETWRFDTVAIDSYCRAEGAHTKKAAIRSATPSLSTRTRGPVANDIPEGLGAFFFWTPG